MTKMILILSAACTSAGYVIAKVDSHYGISELTIELINKAW